MPQARVKTADLIMVKAVTDNLEGLYNETGQRPQYGQHQFQSYRYQRGASQQNHTQYGNTHKPYFQGNNTNSYRSRGRAMDLSNSEDMAVEGPIIRVAMEGISISIIHTTHNQNNVALPVVYAVDLIIPPSIATRENMT